MKRTLRLVGMAAMVLLLAVSCKKEEKNNGEKQMMTFSAGIEQGNSKTGLLPNGDHAFNQVWTADDAINVNGESVVIDEKCAGYSTGTFTGEVIVAPKYYAVYPSNATLEGSTATFTLPASQNYVADSYASNLAPLAAVSDNQQLTFKNLCGLMELSLDASDVTVTQLVLSCDRPICGTASPFDMDKLDSETLTMPSEAGKSITLNCGNDGVSGKAASFVFVLPPVESGNFSLEVHYKKANDENAYIQSVALPKGISIKAGEVAYNNDAYPVGIVETKEIVATTVTSTTADVEYTFQAIEGYTVEEHGVCYAKHAAPTYDDFHAEGVKQGDVYIAHLTNLEPGATYYVRAYAKYAPAKDGNVVIVYGNELNFTTLTNIPEGALSGKFTVNSSGKQVYFSKGNLWYGPEEQGATATWNFEKEQYYFRQVNGLRNDAPHLYNNPTVTPVGTRGFFWFSQDATKASVVQSSEPAIGNNDVLFTNKPGAPTEANPNFTANGVTGKWRTLTGNPATGSKGEWEYIVKERAVNYHHYAYVKVDGEAGLLLFPDVFTWPSVSDVDLPAPTTFDKASSTCNDLDYTPAQFVYLENAGCVFLPTPGYIQGYTKDYINNAEKYAFYLSSNTKSNDTDIYYLKVYTNASIEKTIALATCYWMSLRLVTDVPSTNN
ncbi:MAG: hypothetical protein KBT57_06560 [bacterium]|nr:hypothetical protein [Candidatus Limimorpha equi]